MLTRWQPFLVSGLLAAFLTLTFAAQPVQAKGHGDAGKFITGVIVGAILAKALDDDHHRDHHRHVKYYRCPYCGYYGPYQGERWARRHHSHGRRLVLRVQEGPFGDSSYLRYDEKRPRYPYYPPRDEYGPGHHNW